VRTTSHDYLPIKSNKNSPQDGEDLLGAICAKATFLPLSCNAGEVSRITNFSHLENTEVPSTTGKSVTQAAKKSQLTQDKGRL
jgi:hypothetical protein